MARPRNPRPEALVYASGQVLLNRAALERLRESAEARGILRLRWVCWDVQGCNLLLWPCTENEYASALNISGPRQTIQFKSRTLARALGAGHREVKVI